MERQEELIRCEIEAEQADKDFLRTGDPGAYVGARDWKAEQALVLEERKKVQEVCSHEDTYLDDFGTYGTGFASVYCRKCGAYVREYNAY